MGFYLNKYYKSAQVEMQVTQHFSLWLRLAVLVTAFCLSVVSHPLVVDECGPLSLEGKPSYLWEVTHPDRTAKSYLFGTITVPAPLVLNSMPANVLRTLHSSDELVLELNPFDPSSPRKMRACSRFSNATTMLRDVIPRALYRRVVAHLRRVQRLMKSWVTPKQMLEKLRTNAERLSDADVAMEMGIFNYNYDNVVVKRTKVIVARMDELLSANREKSYFFALSLSKLIGGSETRWSTRRSLVDQLVDIGYQVRRLPAEYSSPRS